MRGCYNMAITMQELLAQRESLQAQLMKTNQQILDFADGFWYQVLVCAYGNHRTHDFNNLVAAEDLAGEYYEDNGFAYVYTNNPDAERAYFIESKEDLKRYLDKQGWEISKLKYPEYWTTEHQAALDACGEVVVPREPKVDRYPSFDYDEPQEEEVEASEDVDDDEDDIHGDDMMGMLSN